MMLLLITVLCFQFRKMNKEGQLSYYPIITR